MIDGEGTIYIEGEDWYEFVESRFGLPKGTQFVLGPPRLNMETGEIEISIAFSTSDVHPSDWVDEPKAIRELKGFKQ